MPSLNHFISPQVLNIDDVNAKVESIIDFVPVPVHAVYHTDTKLGIKCVNTTPENNESTYQIQDLDGNPLDASGLKYIFDEIIPKMHHAEVSGNEIVEESLIGAKLSLINNNLTQRMRDSTVENGLSFNIKNEIFKSISSYMTNHTTVSLAGSFVDLEQNQSTNTQLNTPTFIANELKRFETATLDVSGDDTKSYLNSFIEYNNSNEVFGNTTIQKLIFIVASDVTVTNDISSETGLTAEHLSAINTVTERTSFDNELGDPLLQSDQTQLNGKWYAALCFDISTPDPSSSAVIEDGFIMNATVRVRDAMTLNTRGIFISDSNGKISIPNDWGLVAIDVIDSINGEQAVDISTNEPFTGTLSAISDPSSGSDIAVTPLTSLVTSSVVAEIENSIASGTPMQLSDVSNLKSDKLNKVAAAFGVSAEDLEASPINSNNNATAKIAMQISIIEKMVSSVSSESGVNKKKSTKNFMKSLMSRIESKSNDETKTLDLTDSSELSAVVDSTSSLSGVTIEPTKLQKLKQSASTFSSAISNITASGVSGLTELAKLNKVASEASNAGGAALETMFSKDVTEITIEASSIEVGTILTLNFDMPDSESDIYARFDGTVRDLNIEPPVYNKGSSSLKLDSFDLTNSSAPAIINQSRFGSAFVTGSAGRIYKILSTNISPYHQYLLGDQAGPWGAGYTWAWSMLLKPTSLAAKQIIFSNGNNSWSFELSLDWNTWNINMRRLGQSFSVKSINVAQNKWIMLTLVVWNKYMYVYEGNTLIYTHQSTNHSLHEIFYGTGQYCIGGREVGDGFTYLFDGEFTNMFFASPAPTLYDIEQIHIASTLNDIKKNLNDRLRNLEGIEAYVDSVFYLDGSIDPTDNTALQTIDSRVVVDSGLPTMVTSPYGAAFDLSTNQHYKSSDGLAIPYSNYVNWNGSSLYVTWSFYFKPNTIPTQKEQIFAMKHPTMNEVGMFFGIVNNEYFMKIGLQSGPTYTLNEYEFKNSNFQIGQWTLLTIMIRGKFISIYESDVLLNTVNGGPQTTAFYLEPLLIGNHAAGHSSLHEHFDGQVASFEMFNHGSISDTTYTERGIHDILAMQQLRNGQTAPVMPDLVDSLYQYPLTFVNTLDSESMTQLPLEWKAIGEWVGGPHNQNMKGFFQDLLPAEEEPTDWWSNNSTYNPPRIQGTVRFNGGGSRNATVVWGARLNTAGKKAFVSVDGVEVDVIDETYASGLSPPVAVGDATIIIKSSTFPVTSGQIIHLENYNQNPIGIKSVSLSDGV